MTGFSLPPPVAAQFAQQVQRQAERAALTYFTEEGELAQLSWRQLGDRVLAAVGVLRERGIAAGDHVATLAPNSPAWIVFDLAIACSGAVHVPLHASLSSAQILAQLRHSRARLVLLDGKEQADKLLAVRSELGDACRPLLSSPFPLWQAHPLGAKCCAAALEQPGIPPGETPGRLADLTGQLSSDAVATIMYTSGTLGQPRGAILTHGNLASNAVATAAAYTTRPDELRFCFLPLSHIYARTCDLYTWLHRGTQLALARGRETLIADIQQVQPTLINAVPYFYEKLVTRLLAAGQGKKEGALRSLLGGRIRICFAGGAALPTVVEDVFARQGIPLLQGYGLTEASPVITTSTESAHRRGSVGRPIEGVELQLAGDGEILTRGPHVMQGYYRDAEATAAVLRDGWLHTGDLGEIDKDGFLFIRGRKKEIIVTAGGKNIAPTALEARLTASELIAQAMVIGEGRKYLAALIVPEPQALRAAIKRQRMWIFSQRAALRHRRVLALYRQHINRALSDLSQHEQIARFVLLPRGFEIERGEVTPKASLCRSTIQEHFSAAIEALF